MQTSVFLVDIWFYFCMSVYHCLGTCLLFVQGLKVVCASAFGAPAFWMLHLFLVQVFNVVRTHVLIHVLVDKDTCFWSKCLTSSVHVLIHMLVDMDTCFWFKCLMSFVHMS